MAETNITLKSYNSPQEFLDAVSPFLIPQWEWIAHLPLGLCLERSQSENQNPRDYFVATWAEDVPQIIMFHFHSISTATPVNLTACRAVEELLDFPAQIDLLVKYAADQPQIVLNAYSTLDGDAALVEPFASLLARRLGREAELITHLRGSYVDQSLLKPWQNQVHHPRPVLRQCKAEDNIEEIAKLFQQFQRDTSSVHDFITPLPELVKMVASGIEKGSYYSCSLEDGTIVALCMLRRHTANGIGITLVVTRDTFRRRGYGAALTSWVVEHALAKGAGGLGKQHVTIFWEEGGAAGKMYRKLGFVEGYLRQMWKLVT